MAYHGSFQKPTSSGPEREVISGRQSPDAAPRAHMPPTYVISSPALQDCLLCSAHSGGPGADYNDRRCLVVPRPGLGPDSWEDHGLGTPSRETPLLAGLGSSFQMPLSNPQGSPAQSPQGPQHLPETSPWEPSRRRSCHTCSSADPTPVTSLPVAHAALALASAWHFCTGPCVFGSVMSMWCGTLWSFTNGSLNTC